MSALSALTPRERFLETVLFGRPDKIPFQPGHPRKSTLEAWRTQGLGANENWHSALLREVGIKEEKVAPQPGPGVNFLMMPIFDEKVLEHRDGHYVVQDWMGNVTEISDQYDYTYIRKAIDFVTRRWLKFPVTDRASFAKMKERYNPNEPGRFPEDFKPRCKKLRGRRDVCGISFAGPFWQLREWVGFEPLCMLLLDDPDFVKEMIAFWTEFVSRTLAPILEEGVVDYVRINEDMAYKQKPMISPAMTREFLQPAYNRWTREVRQAGVKVFGVDSDGRVDLLLPIWIESGMNLCEPFEVAAGCDIVAYRRQFGKKMAFLGGVDKRCMAAGGSVLEAELARVAPVVRDGGYIPSCDHGVPPDISWPNFVYYSRLLAELTGWR